MELPTKNAKTTHVLEAMVTEILARLPLRSIFRFKSVCKTWKSTLESEYFRRLFLSVHRNSSWSLLFRGKELIRFRVGESWDLPKSSPVFIPESLRSDQNEAPAYCGRLVLIEGCDHRTCFVGDPIVKQWIKIPPPPVDDSKDFDFGLVKRDKSFIVFGLVPVTDHDMSVFVYSSETGVWTSKIVHCPHQIIDESNYISIGTTIYLSSLSEPRALVTLDIYSESDQFRVLHYPDHSSDNNPDFKRALTASNGYYMYIRTLAKKEQVALKVWKLNDDDSGDISWQLLWDIGIPIVGLYVPMAMNYYDEGVVYLWSQQDHHVVSCDFRTQKHKILSEEDQDCFIYQSVCEKSMDETWGSGSSDEYNEFSIRLTQFVLPRWIETVPRPPQTEVIDTTSLLSHIKQENKKVE